MIFPKARNLLLLALIWGATSASLADARSRKETKVQDTTQIADEVDAIEGRFFDSRTSVECMDRVKRIVADVRLGNSAEQEDSSSKWIVQNWTKAYGSPNRVVTTDNWINLFGVDDEAGDCRVVQVLFMSQYERGTKKISLASYDLSNLKVVDGQTIYGVGEIKDNSSTAYYFRGYAGGFEAGTKSALNTSTRKDFACIGNQCVVATLAEAFDEGWLTPATPLTDPVKSRIVQLAQQKRLQQLEAYRAQFRSAVSSAEWETFIGNYSADDPDRLIPAARGKKAQALLNEYRAEFKAASSTTALDVFIQKYGSNDPDKLIPKARKLRIEAKAREEREREEAERRWRADAPRREHNSICDSNFFTCKAGCSTIVGSHYEAWSARNSCEANCDRAKSSCYR